LGSCRLKKEDSIRETIDESVLDGTMSRTTIHPHPQAAPSELHQGPVPKLQMQVPGVPLEHEGEAVTVAKEMCDAQLKTWNAEIKLRKKQAVIPTYAKILVPPVLLLSIILCILAITSVPSTFLAFHWCLHLCWCT